MARNKGGFVFASNFEVKLKEALDPRVAVSAKADLINKETWPYDGDTIYLYNGLIVSAGNDGVYRLIDVTKITEADYSGWQRIDAAAAEKLTVVDNLESEDSNAALSAKQGKVLMNEINTVAGKLVGVYTFRGSKETFAELPEEGMIAGDVWNVNEKVGNHPAGTNWAWTGEAWDALAGSIDLSAYSTTSEIEALLKVESDRAIAKEEELQLLIEGNAGEISKANGEISAQALQIEGITKSIGEINDLNIEQNTKIAALEALIFGENEEKPAETILELIENNASEVVTLQGDTEELKKNINILNSGSDVEGSVDNKISQAFEWINIEV
jgi:hypothetical protein